MSWLRHLLARIDRALAALAVSIEMNTQAMKVKRALDRAPLSHRTKKSYHRGQRAARLFTRHQREINGSKSEERSAMD